MPQPPQHPFDEAASRIRESGHDNREQGRQFENLVKHFLQNDPLQKNEYEKIQLWREWAKAHGEPQQDAGIDLVATRHDGGVTAIQAKFYQDTTPISRKDIDTFFAASGKKPFTHRLLVTTTEKWGREAEKLLPKQQIQCTLMGLGELRASPIEWASLFDSKAKAKTKTEKKKPRPHQKEAIADVRRGLQAAERGRLVMACGTGKTYTALQIAEAIAGRKGRVLFLVPSLSLLSQALHAWAEDASLPLRNFVVCSDSYVGRDNEDMLSYELAIPATTEPKRLAAKLKQKFEAGAERLTVVFATYHSIDTVIDAQKKHNAPAFDLVICDEAHRTAGTEKINEQGTKEISYYLKVHDAKKLKATKRLYMTATPRIFSASSVQKAQEHEVAIYSMDNEKVFGRELHRLGFGKAVEKGLLSDYKVIVLCLNEDEAASIGDMYYKGSELKLEDKAKIIGCYNGLAKNFNNFDGTPLSKKEKAPMRRAVAFSTKIEASKQFEQAFNEILEKYFSSGAEEGTRRLKCEVQHIDGTMNAMVRNKALDWLRDPQGSAPSCRVLTNARCLSEGVDVPALDAVMFLNPRKSQVDVVQSVGRVMRTAPGKEYGYVMLPIVLPSDKEPEEALNQHEKYKVVWQVLQALRAHDERFNVMINQLELNKKKPEKINIVRVNIGGEVGEESVSYGSTAADTAAFPLIPDFDKWQDAILARIVKKCGEKDYWENWAKDVGDIAQTIIKIINALLKKGDDKLSKRFEQFLKRLQKNLNPAVTKADAIEMLAQHIITRPVFDALFEGYAFAKQNPVSRSMQQMISLLDKHGLESETESLKGFYDSVRRRAAGIDNAAGKQKVMLELYDKFFAIGFRRHAERLGIVYTPVEIVDFIVQSAEAALKKEFGRSLTDKGVHILDPFTGTGTFMARLLRGEKPLIDKKDLPRKYKGELHANEITLLAYYIAAINIEEIYHDRTKGNYSPFQGIVLTDTFQLSETKDDLHEDYFKENSARAKRQRTKPIQVIIGNPPYSAGQTSANDDNPNQKYPVLDKRITATYVKDSPAVNRNSLYDSYIRSIRWASDRIKDEGIIAFVTNGSFIDSNATAGLRKHLLKDFSAVYCFNLRGNQRTSGETSRREGGKVFGTGSRTPVAITVMIKRKDSKGGKLYYHDIGDYLTREHKLELIKHFEHYGKIKWKPITPNEQHDWINQRHPEFMEYPSMEGGIFATHSPGLKTNRDIWVYNFCRNTLLANMKKTIGFYNGQVDTCQGDSGKVSYDTTKISWTDSLESSLEKGIKGKFNKDHIRVAMYRPFTKRYLYYDKFFLERPAAVRRFFPTPKAKNLVIVASGVGANKDFSAFMVDIISDLEVVSKSQCFALYRYEEESSNLLGKSGGRQDNISDATLSAFRDAYKDKKLSKEDIFYYVYGILHSPQYKEKYAADLGRMLPRIPQVKGKAVFAKFAKAGRALADLHLNYETQPEYPLKKGGGNLLSKRDNYEVQKMRFGGKMGAWDKTVIKYNDDITLTGIPMEAYEYQVNGKSAIEWIMERYQHTTDTDSRITNDPNAWSDDPTYILSLLKRVVHVSVESVKIVKGLPGVGV